MLNVVNTSKVQPKSDCKAVFENIISKRLWKHFETLCGVNSSMKHTMSLRRSLQLLLDSGFTSSMLDVGCGDFNWMSKVDLKNIQYTGIDVVSQFIDENKKKYAAPNIRFEEMDIVDTVPPKHDMVFCRGLFTFLSEDYTIRAFNNIKKSGARLLAASSYFRELVKAKNLNKITDTMNSSTIPTGQFRAVNLCLVPYFFRPPMLTLFEDMKGRSIDIWQLDDLPYLYESRVKNPTWCNPLTAEDLMQLEFFRKICELPFVSKVQLFGSRALKKHKVYSDIDLLVHCDEENLRENWLKVLEIVYYKNIPLSVDAHHQLDIEEFNDVGHDNGPILQYAKTVYERKK